MLFPVKDGWQGLEKAMDYLCMLADEAIEQGVNIFILSDRRVSREMAPIPALLAGWPASPPDPQQDAHPVCPGSRKRRAAGTPLLAADWLWGNRNQPLTCL